MAITVKHSKTSAIPDAGDTTLVQPSDWNADHTLTGTVPVANGGTGASTASDGLNALLPSQTANSGKVLTTDGTNASWATNGSGTVTSVAATVPAFLSVSGSPITTSGTLALTYSGTALPVANGGTGATTLTGYVKGSGTTALTASSTIPSTDITGLGTMSTQNANAVAVTGGAIDGTTIGATTPSTGAFTYGSTNNTTSTTPALSYNASNSSFVNGATVAGSYLQNVMQNKSASAGASTNFAVSNNLGTDSTYYGEFGMNSSVFSSGTPVDFFSLNNGIYYSGHDGDITYGSGNGYKTYLAWGTSGQSAHVINATGAIGLNTNITGTTNFGTSGQVLTSAGSGATPTWSTPTTGTVTSVTGTSPVVSSGGNTPAISMPAATTSVSGYLTSTDWNTFNGKSNTNGTVTSVAALTIGTTGTDLSSTVATGTTTPVITLQVPTASATNRGALSAADWTTFNNKGSGTVTSVTGTAPVVSSGGATPAISMAAATGSVNGYLTSTDWTTFNNKGSGTVTAVSVASANGFAGTSSGGATPALTLTTSISGVLKGSSSALAAATAGTDFVAPATATSFTAQQYFGNVALTDAATIAWAANTAQVATFTFVSSNRTMGAPTGLVSGAYYGLAVIQNSGSNTLTWNSVFKWAGGTAPTLSTAASAKDYFVFRTDGTNMYEQGRSLGVA